MCSCLEMDEDSEWFQFPVRTSDKWPLTGAQDINNVFNQINVSNIKERFNVINKVSSINEPLTRTIENLRIPYQEFIVHFVNVSNK